MKSTCHIIGAGLAGLSAAVRIASAGGSVILYEGAPQAGGRCRSYVDAKLGRRIDNGNHLVLSGNRAALDYLTLIGSRDQLSGPGEPAFPFFDSATGERWSVRPNVGPVPWWVLVRDRRIPATRFWDYVGAMALAFAGPDKSVADVVSNRGPMAERFWEPFTVAVMNAPMEAASARLLWSVLRETFARGGEQCLPLFAENGLGAAFIEPALRFIGDSGGAVTFNKRLARIRDDGVKVTGLAFRDEDIGIGEADNVVLAVSPSQLAALRPALDVPKQSGLIINAHFVVDRDCLPPTVPPFVGLLNGTAQWVFVRNDILSVTISAAEALGLDGEREDMLLRTLWTEVSAALKLDQARTYLAGRIVKEKRATFDQSPEAARHRPKTRTELGNLVLAGDVIDTGLPATIEGAIRSGEQAAREILQG